jgi:hypothetical protein
MMEKMAKSKKQEEKSKKAQGDPNPKSENSDPSKDAMTFAIDAKKQTMDEDALNNKFNGFKEHICSSNEKVCRNIRIALAAYAEYKIEYYKSRKEDNKKLSEEAQKEDNKKLDESMKKESNKLFLGLLKKLINDLKDSKNKHNDLTQAAGIICIDRCAVLHVCDDSAVDPLIEITEKPKKWSFLNRTSLRNRTLAAVALQKIAQKIAKEGKKFSDLQEKKLRGIADEEYHDEVRVPLRTTIDIIENPENRNKES